MIRIKRIEIGQTGFGLQWLCYGAFMPEECEKCGLRLFISVPAGRSGLYWLAAGCSMCLMKKRAGLLLWVAVMSFDLNLLIF